MAAGLTKTELAYMAGIFDGEGWVGVNTSRPYGAHKSPRYSLVMGVANTYMPVLEMFSDYYGGDIQRQSPSHDKTSNKICYTWRTCSHKARIVLNDLMPYLTIKKEQAIIAIEYIDKHCKLQHGTKLTKEVLADREMYKLRIVSAR